MAPMTAQRRFARIAGEDEDDSDLYDPRAGGRKAVAFAEAGD